ncbi:MAG: hypothetical protein H0T42_13030 [Deltaproteobacteria bacterium]|nr:hypothetical protein [Deltaproteobacteria bacterium]
MRVAVLLAIAACGDNVEPDPNVARSGSRLKLVHYDYGDGVRETETQWFHDDARAERCTPRTWSDGIRICTPAFTDTVFPSSSCDRALGRVPIGEAPPPYFVRHYWLAGTWMPSKIYLAAEGAEPPAQAWELRDGACLGPYDAAGFEYFELGGELPRSELARITHPELAVTSRLGLVIVASDDGLHVPTGLRDRELDAPCRPERSPGAAEAVCVPDGAATADYFHDAQCAEPELAVAVGDRVPALIRHHDAASGCTSYHKLGAEVEAPPLFHRNGPSCVPIAAPTSNVYYLAGAPRELARLDRVTASSPGRLHAITLAADDVRIADAFMRDDALDSECRRTEIDGALRCLPVTTIEVIELFDDATCRVVVPLAEVHTGACSPAATFALAAGGALHAIGAVHGAALFHLSTGDRCLPYAIPTGIALHDVGPASPAQAFAEATVVVDP